MTVETELPATRGAFSPEADDSPEGGDLDRIVLLNTLPPPRLDPEVLERHVEVREGGFGEPTVLGESLGLTVGHRLNVGVIETVPRQPPESAARRPLSFEEGEEANIPPI